MNHHNHRSSNHNNNTLVKFYLFCMKTIKKILAPIFALYLRLWIASIFLISGLNKFKNINSTITLFKNQYAISILEPKILAYVVTSFELLCSTLLIIGLGSRIATLPLLTIIALIKFTPLHIHEHMYLAILLATILFYGPGKISIDHIIRNKLIKPRGHIKYNKHYSFKHKKRKHSQNN